jgi:hypothetical protein
MGTQRSDDSKIDDFLKKNFEENIWTHKRKRRSMENQNQ